MASVIRLETKNKETPQDDDQSNIGAGVAIDAAEVLAGSLLCILPWTRPAGMFMVTDGVRRILNDLEENDNG